MHPHTRAYTMMATNHDGQINDGHKQNIVGIIDIFCGHHCMWPSWFVAIMDLAVMVYVVAVRVVPLIHHHDCTR